MTLFYVRFRRRGRLRGPYLTMSTALIAAGLRGRVITRTWQVITTEGSDT